MNFLVGVDDSGYGILSFQRALRIAGPGDTLYLLTINEKAKEGRIAEENKRTFKQVCLEKKIKCVSLTESGSAREIFLRKIDELHIDILVLGVRSRSTLRKAVLGSTTDYCLRFAPCSVLVAKKSDAVVDAPY